MHAPGASQARACVLCANLLHCCCQRTWPAQGPGAMQLQANTFFTLHTALFTSRTLHFTLALHLIANHVSSSHLTSPHLSSSHLIPSLLTCHLGKFFSTVFISPEHWPTCLISSKFFSTNSTPESSYCQREVSCTKKQLGTESFCIQKLETQMRLHRKAFAKYFVLQSLHKELPNTTLYYNKACAKHSPVLLCTTKLAQSTSQYYFVLQSLHKALPSTTVLLQSSHQYYFVPQILHKALPSTTLYCRACTK